MLIVLVALAGVGAFGVSRFLAPPATAPAFDGPRPAIGAGPPISHQESITVDMAVADYVAWSTTASLEQILQGSNGIPRVVRTDPLQGEWGDAGARRRVVLEDGHYSAEEILVNEPPRLFRYQVWGYTNFGRLMIDSAIGEFTFEDVDGMTEVTWTYSFYPTVGMVRPVLSSFVDGTWSEFMRNTLATMKAAAEAERSALGGAR